MCCRKRLTFRVYAHIQLCLLRVLCCRVHDPKLVLVVLVLVLVVILVILVIRVILVVVVVVKSNVVASCEACLGG